MVLTLFVVIGLAGCAPSGPATAPPTGTVVCKNYGDNAAAVPLGWSANGRWLAVRLLPPNSHVDEALILGWPSLESSTIYSDAGAVDMLAPDGGGTTLYWWGTHAGTDGIWSLQAGKAPKLVGTVPPGARGGITWTPSGIARQTSPQNDPTLSSVSRTDWTGEDAALLPLKQRDDIWIDTDGEWIADMEQLHPSGLENIVVYHAGTEATLAPSVDPNLLGMTPTHDALIYRSGHDADNHVVPLVLHLLPLDGRPERTMTIRVPFTSGVSNLVFSSQGVLAFTDADFKSDEVCFVPLAFPKVG